MLRDALDTPTDTLAKLLHSVTSDDKPDWVQAIGPRTLVVIDEAGLAGTLDLDRAVTHILERGGCVRLIGDDRQLASVAAGGILRDLAAATGAVTLDTAVRFSDPTEATATTALRDGDPAAPRLLPRPAAGPCRRPQHRRRLRLRGVGRRQSRAGKDAVLLAATRDTVTALNHLARTHRLATDGPPGREVSSATATRPASAT